MSMCKEVLYHILLGFLDLNWLRGLDPIATGYKPVKQAYMENRVNTCEPALDI